MSSHPFESLRPLFNPRSVAIIGASATPLKHSNVALKYLVQGGFTGAIYPINPAGGEIDGLTCYPTITDVPGDVDCVFALIPASVTVDAVRACAAKGVKVAVIGASGFAELNTEEGAAREREITAIAEAAGMRVLGPNTNGVWNAADKFSLGFNTSHGDEMVAGAVSIVAHSGALFDSIAPSLRRLGVNLSKFVSVGNEADIDMLDVIDYYIADDATRVIGLIVESLSDGERFRDLVGKARAAGKPIVALKLGRSAAGAGATLAHSSRLAGSARAYETFFAECGVASVPSIAALAGATAVLAGVDPRKLRGDQGLVCVTTSGGGGALLADHAAERDIPLATDEDGVWTGATADAIATFEDTGLVRNPIDGGALGGWPRLQTLFEAMESDDLNGPVALFAHRLPQEARDMQLADVLIARAARTHAPLVVASPGGLRPAVDAHLRASGAIVFEDIGACFDSLAAFYDVMAAMTAPSAEAYESEPLEAEALLEIEEALATAPIGGFLSEVESARVLDMAGVPMIDSEIATSAAAAVIIAKELGFPVVMKALVPNVAHKNDAGLVMVDIDDEAAVRAGYLELGKRAARAAPDHPPIIIVQPMAASRAELIIGATYEPALGHFLIVGLGGIHAEMLDSVVLIPAFVSDERLAEMVEGSIVGELVERLDADGEAELFDQTVEALLALRDLLRLRGDDIASIDVNPLLLTSEGCVGVDALIVRR